MALLVTQLTANWCNLPHSAASQKAVIIKICDHSKTDIITVICSFVFTHLSRSRLRWGTESVVSLATTPWRITRKTYCILICPDQASNTSQGRFLGIILTICSSSSLINLSISQAKLKAGMLLSSCFSTAGCCGVHAIAKTTLIHLPISFSALLSHVNKPQRGLNNPSNPFPAKDCDITPTDADPNAEGESVVAASNTGHNLIHTGWSFHCRGNPEPSDELSTRNMFEDPWFLLLYPDSGSWLIL